MFGCRVFECLVVSSVILSGIRQNILLYYFLVAIIFYRIEELNTKTTMKGQKICTSKIKSQQNQLFQSSRMEKSNWPQNKKKNHQKTKKQSEKHNRQRDLASTPRSHSSNHNTTSDLAQSMLSSRLEPHPYQCLCNECTCGRHLCKLESPSLSLSLASTYKVDYPPRKPYKHRQPIRPASAKLPGTPLLTGRSTYLDNYSQIKGDPVQRPRPEDLIKNKGGPSAELTRYKEEFPGHRGKNQYVPMNPQNFRGGLAFSSLSTYSQEFKSHGNKATGTAKPPDQFRMTGSWLGKSSYSDQFQNPRTHISKGTQERVTMSQCSARSRCSSSTGQRNASSHFRTTYKMDYTGDKSTVCPAATKLIEAGELSKSHFKQNTHFKGMDSNFASLAKFAF